MTPINRRHLLAAGLAGAWPSAWAQGLAVSDARTLLQQGGLVLGFRHALAPGTFDPPQFRLGECSTQRNLSEEGRAQARRIGAWFDAAQLQPAAVRSSPWCRCMDTATLAFGRAEPWAALGSPHGSPEATSAEHLQALRAALRGVSAQRGRLEVWVTHMFMLAALVQQSAASGEGLVLRSGADGAVQLLGRIAPA
ncbi:MAG: histidine phosphatase family protein [Rubrivivax sp.]|nr:histidine phosphatase family protein [Rubrivivax sp.]